MDDKAYKLGIEEAENSPFMWFFNILNLTIKEDLQIHVKYMLESKLLDALEKNLHQAPRMNGESFKELFRLESTLILISRLLLQINSSTTMLYDQFKRISYVRIKLSEQRKVYLENKQKCSQY